MKYKFYIGFVIVVLLMGCATTEEIPPEEQPQLEAPLQQEEQPPKDTSTVEVEISIPLEEPEEEPEIPADIKELLEKGKTALKGYSYVYKTPDTNLNHIIHVKGNKFKVRLPEVVTFGEYKDKYDTIYFDTEKKTAAAYCINCENFQIGKEKITTLDYEWAYIETALDYLAMVTEAKKIGEVEVENRKSTILDTNIGGLTVEQHYGFLYKRVDGEDKWEFTEASFNSVKDSDVNPP